MKDLKWRIKMFFTKIRYPKAGHYERICITAYGKKAVEEMIENAVMSGWIVEGDREGREEVCATDVGYWEY